MTFKTNWDLAIQSLSDDASPELGGNINTAGNYVENTGAGGTLLFRTANNGGGSGGNFSFTGGTGTTNGASAFFSLGAGTVSGGHMNIFAGDGDAIGGNVILRVGKDTTDESNNGYVQIEGKSTTTVATTLRLRDAGSGSDYIGLKAPDAVTGTYTYTLPGSFPTTGQALVSTNLGIMSWATKLSNVLEDTSPQLGGALDTNGKAITRNTAGIISITGYSSGTAGGSINIQGGDGSASGGDINLIPGEDFTDNTADGVIQIQPKSGSAAPSVHFFQNSGVSKYIGLKAPAAVTTSRTLTLPDGVGVAGQALITDGNDPAITSWATVLTNPVTANLDMATYNIVYDDSEIFSIGPQNASVAGTPGSVGVYAQHSSTAGGGAARMEAGDSTAAGGVGGSFIGQGGDGVSDGGAALLTAGSSPLSGGDIRLTPGLDTTDQSLNGAVEIWCPTGTTTATTVRFYEGRTNGLQYVGLKAPDAIPSVNFTYTLPVAKPSLNGNTSADGNAMVSDESGIMQWDAVTHDSATLQTTNNTTQDLRTFALPVGSAVVVEFTIVAYDTTNGEGGSVRHGSGSGQNVGGTSTLIASTATLDGLTTSGATVTVDVDNALDVLRVRVTGATATTIDWKISARILTQ